MKKIGVIVCAVLALGGIIHAASGEVKLISLGFSAPSPKLLLENMPLMEKCIPGNGTSIHIDLRAPNGKLAHRHSLFKTNWRWERSWFDQTLKDLKAIHSKKLTDNFLAIAVTGHTFDFFDDKAWDCVYHNIRIWTELAKEGGLKGFLLDTEYYDRKNKIGMFQFNPKAGRSFQEYAAKGRQRGREFMRTIAAIYPEVTIISLFGFSHNFPALDAGTETEEALKTALYGLQPSFLNGMLDELPPKARFYDGTEFTGYTAKNHMDYLRIVSEFYLRSPLLCAPENLAKLYAQSGPAIPLYLDSYINTTGFWRIQHKTMDRMKLFRRNLRYSLENSRGYVWLYYDAKAKFYPVQGAPFYESVLKRTGGGKAKLFSEVMPGIYDMVDSACNPKEYALKRIAQGKAVKVFADSFEKGLRLSQWSSGKKGRFEIVSGGLDSAKALRFNGVIWGSVSRDLQVKAGDLYLVRGAVRASEDANPTLGVSWKLAGEKVLEPDAPSVPFPERTAGVWKKKDIVVFIPDGVDKMNVSFGLRSKSEKAFADFDCLEVYRID